MAADVVVVPADVARSRKGGKAPPSGIASPTTVNIGSDLGADEVEFGRAVEKFRRERRLFPNVSDYLAIAKGLGYRKVAQQ